MERPAPSIPSVGAYLGRQGSFFLRRGRDVKEIFSFTEPTVTITQEQIMGRKPSAEAFKAHSSDQGTWEEAQELSWVDYVKLTTTREDYTIPRTLRRRDVARVLEENTLPPMLRGVLNLLKLRGRAKRQMEVCAKPVQEENHTLDLGRALHRISCPTVRGHSGRCDNTSGFTRSGSATADRQISLQGYPKGNQEGGRSSEGARGPRGPG